MGSLEHRPDDGTISPTLWAVALTGAVMTLVSPFLFGASGVVSTGIGAALAVANLWAMGKLVRGLLGGASGSGGGMGWAPLGLLKLFGLFVVLYILVRHDLARVLPLAFGYVALPFGIVLSQLRTGTPARREN